MEGNCSEVFCCTVMHAMSGLVTCSTAILQPQSTRGQQMMTNMHAVPMLDALAAGLRECRSKPTVGDKLQLDAFLDGMLRSRSDGPFIQPHLVCTGGFTHRRRSELCMQMEKASRVACVSSCRLLLQSSQYVLMLLSLTTTTIVEVMQVNFRLGRRE